MERGDDPEGAGTDPSAPDRRGQEGVVVKAEPREALSVRPLDPPTHGQITLRDGQRPPEEPGLEPREDHLLPLHESCAASSLAAATSSAAVGTPRLIGSPVGDQPYVVPAKQRCVDRPASGDS